MAKEYFYQSETINYNSGTTARTLFKEIILDSAYDRCVGIAVFESKSGGIASYRIGVDDKDKQYISAVHKDLLISDKTAGMEPEKRFLPVNIKAGGHKIKIATALPVDLVSDLEYDVVLRLERDEQTR
jgi:hypothetical protein